MANDNDSNPNLAISKNVAYLGEDSLAAVFERVGGQARRMSDESDESEVLAESADETQELIYGDVFSNLNELIDVCRDSEYSFRECAGNSEADNLTELLTRYADETQSDLEELQSFVREMGGKAEGTGSVFGALQRGWVSVRGTLAGYSPESVLAECESAQETLLVAYNTAQEQNLPEEIMEVVMRQAEDVRQKYTRIKELRNSLQAED